MSREIPRPILGMIIFSISFLVLYYASPFIAVVAHQALPRSVGNFLFFWPQRALLAFGLAVEGDGSQWLFRETAKYFAITFWVAFAISFGYITKGMSKLILGMSGVPAIIIATIVLLSMLNLFGYPPAIVGP